MSDEIHAHRLKRMKMRAWRRGTREMDLLLGPYADANLATMDDAELRLFDQLLQENDPDLMAWATGVTPPPIAFSGLIAELLRHAKTH